MQNTPKSQALFRHGLIIPQHSDLNIPLFSSIHCHCFPPLFVRPRPIQIDYEHLRDDIPFEIQVIHRLDASSAVLLFLAGAYMLVNEGRKRAD